MAKDQMPPGWIKAENELLRVLMEMQSRWADALQAAHQCERLQAESPQECTIRLDIALNEALELEKLVRKYIEALNTMKGLMEAK